MDQCIPINVFLRAHGSRIQISTAASVHGIASIQRHVAPHVNEERRSWDDDIITSLIPR
jgi:hypothetical protein